MLSNNRFAGSNNEECMLTVINQRGCPLCLEMSLLSFFFFLIWVCHEAHWCRQHKGGRSLCWAHDWSVDLFFCTKASAEPADAFPTPPRSFSTSLTLILSMCLGARIVSLLRPLAITRDRQQCETDCSLPSQRSCPWLPVASLSASPCIYYNSCLPDLWGQFSTSDCVLTVLDHLSQIIITGAQLCLRNSERW